MTDTIAAETMIAPTAARVPWHLWLAGIVSLLWNSLGAFDYTMTHVRGEEYLRQMQMGEDVIAWLAAVPVWATAGWALGVWGGVVGSILLLARSRHAVTAFAVSLAGVLLMTAFTLTTVAPASMTTPGAQAFEWAIKLVAVLLLAYAWAMRRRGVLR